MVARGFAPLKALTFNGLGGASLMNNCRPSVLVIFAIWALAVIAQTASVARMKLAASAVRFTIVPLGKANPRVRGFVLANPRQQTIKRLPCPGRSDLIGTTRLAKRCLGGRVSPSRHACLSQAGLPTRRQASGAGWNYSHSSSREGIELRALFSPNVSFPPASAKSGLPPPEPPTFWAIACISLPAWTL